MVQHLLDVTFKQNCHVHFGPYKDIFEAIPYIANNIPAPKSRFDHCHEMLIYTIRMYLKLDIPDW